MLELIRGGDRMREYVLKLFGGKYIEKISISLLFRYSNYI